MRLMRTPSVGWDRDMEHQPKEQIKNKQDKSCEYREAPKWRLRSSSVAPVTLIIALRRARTMGGTRLRRCASGRKARRSVTTGITKCAVTAIVTFQIRR